VPATVRHSLIDHIFAAIEWLAVYPPCGLDPFYAHEYWPLDATLAFGHVPAGRRKETTDNAAAAGPKTSHSQVR
jgi:hypothetical protein